MENSPFFLKFCANRTEPARFPFPKRIKMQLTGTVAARNEQSPSRHLRAEKGIFRSRVLDPPGGNHSPSPLARR